MAHEVTRVACIARTPAQDMVIGIDTFITDICVIELKSLIYYLDVALRYVGLLHGSR